MEKNEHKPETNAVYAAFIAGKPVEPFTRKNAPDNREFPDPSSSLKAGSYPVPSSFEYRSNPIERDYA